VSPKQNPSFRSKLFRFLSRRPKFAYETSMRLRLATLKSKLLRKPAVVCNVRNLSAFKVVQLRLTFPFSSS
jgi:hypothetical protein